MCGLAPQQTILLAVQRINFDYGVTIVVLNDLGSHVVMLCASLVQFLIAYILWFLGRCHSLMRINHCVFRCHARHTVGIEDSAEFVDFKFGVGFNLDIFPAVNCDVLVLAQTCEHFRRGISNVS